MAESTVYVDESVRGRGVGRDLLRHSVACANAGGLWTLQASVSPENGASLSPHHTLGFRTIGTRERIARLHGVWRDTVLLERRRGDD